MKFSVIIPTYQRPRYLEMAIESVMSQTYKNFEIIVVNDNPEDKTVIDNLFNGNQKIKLLHHKSSKGGNAARNLGIQNSSGDLIAFLDDDDIWLPEKLASHLAMHQKHPNAGLIFSNCLYVHNNPLIADQATSSNVPENIIKAMGEARFCPTTSSIVTIRKEIVETCGLFDERMVSLQDWDYWFRIAHRYEFAHIPELLVLFRQHLGDRVSQNEEKRLQGIDQICCKWGDDINIHRFRKSMTRILYYQLSINALMSGNRYIFLKKSFHLLNRTVITFDSVKSYFNLWLHLLIKNRKRRLQLKLIF